MRVILDIDIVSPSVWTGVLAALAAAAVLGGSVLAAAQHDVRTGLGYLAAAQAGLALVGVLAASVDLTAPGASVFSLATSAVGVLCVLAALSAAERHGAPVGDAGALAERAPVASVALAVGLLSLVGMPPAVGFFARIFVVQAAFASGYAWLAFAVLVATVVSGAWAVGIVVRMLREPADVHAAPVAVTETRRSRWLPAAWAATLLTLSAIVAPVLALAAGAGAAISNR